MKYKLFNLVVIATMLFGMLTTPALAAVTAAEEPPTARTTVATQSQVTPAFALEAAETINLDEPAYYIIQLTDAPLATYRGDVAGLRATNPQALGEQKLNVNTPASRAYLNYLDGKQSQFLTAAEQTLSRSVEVRHHYQVAYNGVAVQMTAREAEVIAKLPGVARVTRNFSRYIQTDTTPDFLNAVGIWDGANTGTLPGTMGEGIVVGIIDTGINMANPSFAATDGDGYTHTNPLGDGVYTGWCDPDHLMYDENLVCNAKLIGVYSYPGAENNPIDDNSHGSHTASTTAGNVVYNVEYEGYTFAKISGMAPHANIISYDVCYPTPTSASCDLDAILAAIDDAVADSVDVINYSIGGGPTNPWGDVDSEAYLNARDAGVFVATSAGNSGPGAGTVGSPGNAPWIMTVGNSTIGRVIANVFDVTGPGVVPAELENIAAVYGPDGPAITADIMADIIYAGDVDAANILGCDPFPAGSFTDSIALIQRGVCSFAIKVGNAAAAGATAVVVFNNAGGPPIVMGGLAGTTIPAVFISLDEGIAVRDWIQAETDPTARISADLNRVVNNDWADIMAAGSSRGPNVNSDWIKPDIAAPGTNIFAAYAGATDSFGMMSGTSMASPHVAGAGALLRALYPDWTPAEIQSALMLVSAPGLVKENGTTPADPFDKGAGRLDLTNAALVGLVLDETTANFEAADPALGGDPTTLNLASLANQNCVGSCSWTRTFRSVLATDVTYNAWVDAPAGLAITVEPATFTVAAGATQELTITVDADLGVLPSGEWAFAELYIQEATDPAPVATLLDEAFTDITFPPTDWANYKLQGGGTSTWIRDTAQSRSAPASARRIYGSAGDYQDEWLVTPPLDLEDGTLLSYFDRGQWMTYYGYSGVWLSTGSCNPADGEFVELLETDDIPNLAWRATPVSIDLSAYAGETACLAFRYSGDDGHTWWIDDVLVEVYETTAAPLHHLPITVRPLEATPIIAVNPAEMNASQPPDDVTTQILTIANEGGLDLEWTIAESALAMRLGLSVNNDIEGINAAPFSFILDDGVGENAVGVGGSQFIWLNRFSPKFYNYPITIDEVQVMFGYPGAAGGINVGELVDIYLYEDADGNPANGATHVASLHNQAVQAVNGTTWSVFPLAVPATFDGPGDILIAVVNRTAGVTTGTYPAVIDQSSGSQGRSWAGFGAVPGDPPVLPLPTFGVIDSFGIAGNWLVRGFGEGTLPCDNPADVPWLAVAPISGTTAPEGSTDVTISLDSTGLVAGNYQALLCIESNDLANPLIEVPVTLEVQATPEVEIPQAATGLSAVQPQGVAATDTLTINNNGIADLEWEIAEEDIGYGPLSTEVLYDQTGNTTTSGVLAIYDLDEEPDWVVQAADDFVVPADETWFVDTVFAGGFYASQLNPPQGVNVFFYADDNGLPGAELYAYPSLTPTTDDAGDLTLALPTPAELAEGTYWVSVQPRMDYFGDGRWFWLAESVQNHSEFAWRNPSGNYDPGCTDWTPGSGCGFANPDLTFQLLGERSGPCVNLSEISWLSTDPISGITAPGGSDDVTVTFDATGLDAGAYEGNLCVFTNDPVNPLVIVPVSMEVLQTYTLDVNIVGEGEVSVEPEQAAYLSGAVVTLTAVPSETWHFAGWSGDATGTDAEIVITIEGDTSITATFINPVVDVDPEALEQTLEPDESAMDSLVISNLGLTDLIWSLAEDPEVAWLTVNWSTNLLPVTTPAGESATAEVLFDATGLMPGVYTTTLVISTNDPNNPYVFVPVTLTVEIATFTLDVIVEPAGSGLVEIDPDLESYLLGDMVTLTAVPEEGWLFVGWSGDAESEDAEIVITIAGDTVITATFEAIPYMLDVNIVGAGEVLQDPDQETYSFGDVVSLTAIADPGWTFIGWSGDVESDEAEISVTIAGDTVITATFEQDAYTLEIIVEPADSGVVAIDPEQETYVYGDVITLTATAEPGWMFAFWAGAFDVISEESVYTFTITSDRIITATFEAAAYTLDVTVAPAGSGEVLIDPDQATYAYGEVVTLTAVPTTGWEFAGWSGTLDSLENPLVIEMAADHVLVANFIEEGTCVDVAGVTLSLLTQGDLYADDALQFSAVIAPFYASTPFSYTLNGGAEMSTTANPINFSLSFPFSGTHEVTIAVWNCAMVEPISDMLEVTVVTKPVTDYFIYLPLVMRLAP